VPRFDESRAYDIDYDAFFCYAIATFTTFFFYARLFLLFICRLLSLFAVIDYLLFFFRYFVAAAMPHYA